MTDNNSSNSRPATEFVRVEKSKTRSTEVTTSAPPSPIVSKTNNPHTQSNSQSNTSKK